MVIVHNTFGKFLKFIDGWVVRSILLILGIWCAFPQPKGHFFNNRGAADSTPGFGRLENILTSGISRLLKNSRMAPDTHYE